MSQAHARDMSFELVDSPNGDARVRVQGRSYSRPELSGIVLQRLKAAAEDFLGKQLRMRSSLFPHISTTPNGKRLKMRERLPGLRLKDYQRADGGGTRLRVWKIRCGTDCVYDLGAALLIFQFWNE